MGDLKMTKQQLHIGPVISVSNHRCSHCKKKIEIGNLHYAQTRGGGRGTQGVSGRVCSIPCAYKKYFSSRKTKEIKG